MKISKAGCTPLDWSEIRGPGAALHDCDFEEVLFFCGEDENLFIGVGECLSREVFPLLFGVSLGGDFGIIGATTLRKVGGAGDERRKRSEWSE